MAGHWILRSIVVAVVLAGGGGVIEELSAQGAAASPSAPARNRRAPSTHEALDRYLGGDYTSAVRSTPLLARFDTADAEQWVRAGGPSATGRRRLAAALFVLEYAAERPHQMPLLLPWARQELADPRAPHPFEAAWLRAVIAFGERIGAWPFLMAEPDGQIAYARRRFPADPYFRLAEAVGLEVRAARISESARWQPGQPPAFDHLEPDAAGEDPARAIARAEALDRAVSLLEALTGDRAVQAEAELRLGVVRLRQGQRDEALVHLDHVAGLTSDRTLRYLGHVYTGWALGSAGRPSEAIAAYRAALDAVPHAQSATSLLTSLLVRTEDLAGAEQLAGDFLARPANVHDPWQDYLFGDAPQYGALVARLREALR
jgi:tetratricopeptide (TPR) repeat protein